MLGMGALLCDMRDVGAVDVCSGACGGNYFVVAVRFILIKASRRQECRLKKIYIYIHLCVQSRLFGTQNPHEIVLLFCFF